MKYFKCIGGSTYEEATNRCVIVIVLCVIIASFVTGYIIGNRNGQSVRQTGQPDSEFRAELESKQRRIDELEAELIVLRDLVSNAFGYLSGAIEGAERRIEYALGEVGDIRETIGIIRAAVKDLENSLRYYREFVARFNNDECDTGE